MQDDHQPRIECMDTKMLDPASVQFAERTRVQHGIELSYPDKRSGYTNEVIYPAGRVFVPLDVLEALQESEKTWGVGGGLLIHDSHVQWALECAGLLHVETRGAVYADSEQKAAIAEIMNRWSAR